MIPPSHVMVACDINMMRADLREHYAAVRQRMDAAARAHILRPDNRPKRWRIAPAPFPRPLERMRDILILGPTGGRLEFRSSPLVEAIEHVPAWRLILREVAEARGISASAIVGPQRARDIVRARHEVMYRIYNDLCLSLPEIGRRIGGMDHTSVLHGIRQHAKRLAEKRAGSS